LQLGQLINQPLERPSRSIVPRGDASMRPNRVAETEALRIGLT
jgi:hypothetical protein